MAAGRRSRAGSSNTGTRWAGRRGLPGTAGGTAGLPRRTPGQPGRRAARQQVPAAGLQPVQPAQVVQPVVAHAVEPSVRQGGAGRARRPVHQAARRVADPDHPAAQHRDERLGDHAGRVGEVDQPRVRAVFLSSAAPGAASAGWSAGRRRCRRRRWFPGPAGPGPGPPFRRRPGRPYRRGGWRRTPVRPCLRQRVVVRTVVARDCGRPVGRRRAGRHAAQDGGDGTEAGGVDVVQHQFADQPGEGAGGQRPVDERAPGNPPPPAIMSRITSSLGAGPGAPLPDVGGRA